MSKWANQLGKLQLDDFLEESFSKNHSDIDLDGADDEVQLFTIQAFRKFDSDGDGRLSYSEFKKMMNK